MTIGSQKSMDLIWPELVNRFRTPCKSLTFYAYLIFGVLICGGSGVIATVVKSNGGVEEISRALSGYYPALFGAAMLEFAAEVQPYLRFFSYIALSILVLLTLSVYQTQHGWQLAFALLGTALGILFWWVANGLDDRFNDVKPQSALGGDVSSSLPKSQDTGWQK